MPPLVEIMAQRVSGEGITTQFYGKRSTHQVGSLSGIIEKRKSSLFLTLPSIRQCGRAFGIG
jgi:hypothetical protein